MQSFLQRRETEIALVPVHREDGFRNFRPLRAEPIRSIATPKDSKGCQNRKSQEVGQKCFIQSK